MDVYDHGNQQNPSFSKLHIELLEQFEGSRTFTNFIESLLPKNKLNNPDAKQAFALYKRTKCLTFNPAHMAKVWPLVYLLPCPINVGIALTLHKSKLLASNQQPHTWFLSIGGKHLQWPSCCLCRFWQSPPRGSVSP